MRLDAAAEKELDALGKVAHVVKLSSAHGRDDPYYVHHYNARFWCLDEAKSPGVTGG